MGDAERRSDPPRSFQVYNPDRRFTFYSDRTDVLQNDRLYCLSESESLASLASENVFWLDICRPTPDDLRAVAEVFHIHPLTIQDIMSREGREKCETFEAYTFMCMRTCTVRSSPSDLSHETGISMRGFDSPSSVVSKLGSVAPPSESVNLYILLFTHHIITIHFDSVVHVRHVLQRVGPMRNLTQLTSVWIMNALLEDVIDAFVPDMKTVELEVDAIDSMVLLQRTKDQNAMLRRIGHVRNQVTLLLRLFKPKADLLKALLKRASAHMQEDAITHLRDIQDHLAVMLQDLEQSVETLNRAHSNYLAQISIELAEMSNRMNLQVKLLTEITALALPFAIVSGLWGMNVVVPLQMVGGSLATWDMLSPFFLLVLLSVLLSVVFWIIGRRLRFF